MSKGQSQSTVENLIAEHVADTFQKDERSGRPEAKVAQIRERITDSFRPDMLGKEQDNNPPAILELRNRLLAALSPNRPNEQPSGTSARLDALRSTLEHLQSNRVAPAPAGDLEHARTRLLVQREQLFLKNEVTEGFGRIEVGLLSAASLVPLVLKDVSIVWMLPFLGASVARSWHLERQCKRRLASVAKIDAALSAMPPAGGFCS